MSLTIYKASAGSGKTYTLAATYIANLLADDDDFPHKHQLAVTFTNKATAEMKERILQYLYNIATSHDDSDGFFLTLREKVPARITNSMMRSRARNALLNIIHDYDHFHVTTIDSFFQSLLASLAHELGLSASFKVELGDKDVMAKAVDRLLSNLEEDSDEFKWITKYIAEKMDDDKSWNVSNELKDLAKQITKETYMLNSYLLNSKKQAGESPDEEAIELTNELVEEYQKRLNDELSTRREEIAKAARLAHETIGNGLTYSNITRGNNIENYIAKLLDKKQKMKDLAPSKTFCEHADGSKSLLTKPNQKDGNLCNMADNVVPYLADIVRLYNDNVAIINSCQLSLANINPLRLLDRIDKEVNALNKENDRMLLAYTPLLFHKLARGTDTSFVFERAGTQYRHIMIDEFQDTSKLQWDNMRKLLIEDIAQGNECMLVGDVKQGIYRFRGGDWNALSKFSQGYDAELHSSINIVTLDTNFRSGKIVVDFNNRLFTAAPAIVQDRIEETWGAEPKGASKSADAEGSKADAGEQPADATDNLVLDIERIYPTPGEPDNHEVTQKSHNDGGFVRIELLNNVDKNEKKSSKKSKDAPKDDAPDGKDSAENKFEREASIAEQMVRLNEAGVPYRDMAILLRNNKDANPLMKYFEEHHGEDSEHPISLISEEAFLLEASPAVMTIINALRFVNNPTDKIAFEYVRRQLPEGCNADEVKDLLLQWNQQRFSGLPFYEISCRLADLFGLHNKEGQSPYIYRFFDAVLAYVEDNTSSLEAFLQYWDENLHKTPIPSAAIDGVRILTIHKSKGLAFHSVFIPYCDWKIEKSTQSELIWTRPTCEPFNGIPILPIVMTKEAGNSIYRDVYKQETFDKYVENLNLLYVAFTRTQQNLLVWADCKQSGIATILRDALATQDSIIEIGTPSALGVSKSESEEAAEKAAKVEDKGKAKQSNPLQYDSTPITINFNQYAPRLIFRQSNKAIEHFKPAEVESEDEAQGAADASAAEKQEEYRLTGIMLHELMSNIESKDDVAARVEDAARSGHLPANLSTEKVRALITRRISHPTASQWFDGSWQLYRECALIYKGADGRTVTRQPDRVMMRGNYDEGTDETIVVDFKFGKFKPAHREQVQEYMELLRQQGRHNVKGYLWYLYTGSIEEVL